MLLESHNICKNLCRVEFIGKAVDYRNSGIFCKFFDMLLLEAAEFNGAEHPSENACSILDAFFFSKLDVCCGHEYRMSSFFTKCGFKRRTCTGRSLFKNKGNGLAKESLVYFSLVRLFLHEECIVKNLIDFFWCPVDPVEKASAFEWTLEFFCFHNFNLWKLSIHIYAEYASKNAYLCIEANL